jgi:hypothetical protein
MICSIWNDESKLRSGQWTQIQEHLGKLILDIGDEVLEEKI